jgi:hypothetical protein
MEMALQWIENFDSAPGNGASARALCRTPRKRSDVARFGA